MCMCKSFSSVFSMYEEPMSISRLYLKETGSSKLTQVSNGQKQNGSFSLQIIQTICGFTCIVLNSNKEYTVYHACACVYVCESNFLCNGLSANRTWCKPFAAAIYTTIDHSASSSWSPSTTLSTICHNHLRWSSTVFSALCRLLWIWSTSCARHLRWLLWSLCHDVIWESPTHH